MRIETLESRRLMASTVTAAFVPFAPGGGSGVLIVRGTSDSDVIQVSETLEGDVGVVVFPEIGEPYGFTSTADAVIIDAGDGNDSVTFTADSVSALFFLGQGNDTLDVEMGGGASAVAFGQMGDDVFVVNDTLQTSADIFIDGGVGSDEIILAFGADVTSARRVESIQYVLPNPEE